MLMDNMYDLLRKIQTLDFILDDAILYLDTHPMDIAALNYYHKYVALMQKAMSEYNASYGPLTADTVESTNKWTWIDKPWPWEMEA